MVYLCIQSETVVISLSAVVVFAIMRYINLHFTYLCVNKTVAVFCVFSLLIAAVHLFLSVHQLVPPRAPLDHIGAMIWSGARGNITITAL